MSVYAVYLINDHKFISPGDFGVLLSSSFLASLLAPILIGLYLDRTSTINQEKYIIGFVFATLVSQLIFIYAVYIRSFRLALFSQILSGISISSATTTQKTIISTRFQVGLYRPTTETHSKFTHTIFYLINTIGYVTK